MEELKSQNLINAELEERLLLYKGTYYTLCCTVHGSMSKPIRVFFSQQIYHMSCFKSQSEDGWICYKYIQLLHQIQELCGLRLANKLTQSRINSGAQKMKVSLAVQTLSSSVTEAMQTLRVMGMEQFSRSEATEKFLKVISSCVMLCSHLSCDCARDKLDLTRLNVCLFIEFPITELDCTVVLN